MLNTSTTLYTLNDISIVPATIINISSRSMCNPFYQNKWLPVMASPMVNVINDKNYKKFNDAGIITIIPRDNEQLPYEERTSRWEHLWAQGVFVSLSLKEFTEYFIKESNLHPVMHSTRVCIDLANGHMEQLLDACKQAKDIYGSHLVIMTGNIANPNTYLEYAKIGIDYVRCGIGTGSICTTSANSAVHYPMASLIDECFKLKTKVELELEHAKYFFPTSVSEYACAPQIIADGGFTNFDQIIKALALGADFVMCGGIFAKCVEAAAPIHYMNYTIDTPWDLDENTINKMLKDKAYPTIRTYYGMSTKKAQKEMGGEGNKTAEGIVKEVPVSYTVAGWADNFRSYLCSAMSYTGKLTLDEFKGEAQCRLISANSYTAYHK